MREAGEHLLFKLWPVAAGNHGNFDDTEKVMQQPRHFGINRGLTLSQRTVQIANDELFHSAPIL
jgi:hypothetical protein